MTPFVPALHDRIQRLIGVDDNREGDRSFYRPGGNGHLIQFFYQESSDELSELDKRSRRHFFLLELAEKTGIEFLLDDDGWFAVYSDRDKGGIKAIHAAMDLREEDIALIYYHGSRAGCFRLNRKLCGFSGINTCYFSSPILLGLTGYLASIRSLQYYLEQLPAVFRNPTTMKGECTGDTAQDFCMKFAENGRNWFNVESISGYAVDGAQGVLTFHLDGLMQIDTARLSNLLEVASKVFAVLKKRYAYITERHISQATGVGDSLQFDCHSLEIDLPIPIDNLESFARQFADGKNSLRLSGNFQRVSPKLWSVKSTDVASGGQVEIELSVYQIRIKLHRGPVQPLVDRIEQFLRRYVCAYLASIALSDVDTWFARP